MTLMRQKARSITMIIQKPGKQKFKKIQQTKNRVKMRFQMKTKVILQILKNGSTLLFKKYIFKQIVYYLAQFFNLNCPKICIFKIVRI